MSLDNKVTIGAAILGASAVAVHHGQSISQATVKEGVEMLSDDLVRGIAFGAGGGAAVGIVSRASIAEVMGRVFIGGMMAAVAAPWLAETVLKIPTTATSYPVLCTSIGVLGFQLVKNFIHNPEHLPLIGVLVGRLAKPPQKAQEANKGTQGHVPTKQSQTPPVTPQAHPARGRITAPSLD